VGQLNNLVARSYALLYQTDARTWRGLRSFLALEFPATFRRQWRFFLAAALFTSLGAAVSYRLVRGNPANVTLFVSEESGFKDSLEQWKSGNVTGKAADSHNAVYASSLMTNNIQVSFLAFALGVLGGILTVYVLFLNGCILGAFCAAVAQSGQLHNFWPGVLPHGVVEISAIFMAGGAGLSLGWAVLAPGAWTRRDAIALAARDSVKLVVGTVALLVFAGFVEGFLSHSQLPRGFKLGFAAVSGVALYGYLMLSGRTDERRTTDY
jgi:uncharacterized membrane protein SpoIIM required for sporulation